MKKIMFNDKVDLTQKVLEGRKTITRRSIPKKLLESIELYAHGNEEELRHRLLANSSYQIGEVVAIAQSYNDVIEEWKKGYGQGFCFSLKDRAGMTNKMFVRSEEMPHHIKITAIRVEYLQDISDEDCIKEGVEQFSYTFGITKYARKPILMLFGSPREAFAALIDKVSGKGTWDSNPLVWVYEFELVD